MLSYEINGTFKKTYGEKHLPTTVSDLSQLPMQQISFEQSNIMINKMICLAALAILILQTQQSFAEYLFAFVEYILSSDCNGIRNHNHLVRKQTFKGYSNKKRK